MLIRKAILEKIKAGQVTLAFRRWRRPTVKTGGSLKTAVGVIAIQSVEKTTARKISEADAQQAGYAGRDELVKELDRREGQIYKITLTYAGEDPRLELRANDKLSTAELGEIRDRLAKMDASSRVGPWTRKILMSIKKHPHVPAAQLAKKTGFEKDWLKTNIRKLKNLGLTISHHPGYALSPRGVAVVEGMKKR